MDSLWAILQLTVIALLGAAYVALALWDMRQPDRDDRFKPWRDAPEGAIDARRDVTNSPTRTTLGKLL